MSTSVIVSELPECDVHKYEMDEPGVEASYDGKTVRGPWANMCREHFISHGVGLGTGRGQKLVLADPDAEEEKRDIGKELHDAIDNGASFSELEDIVGDGDLAEWL